MKIQSPFGFPGKRSSARCTRGGFSLVELMLAAGILVIAVMGLMATITYSVRADIVSAETTTAMNAARGMMEEIQANADMSAVLATYNNFGFDVPGLVPQAGDADGLEGRVAITSTVVPPTPPAPQQTLLDVRVFVEWAGALGDRRYESSLQLAQH